MSRVRWHPSARQEVFEAAGFYDSKAKGLGAVFLDTVDEALARLGMHPEAGRIILGESRTQVLRRFPYSIVYRIEPKDAGGRLFILAVAHHKRRPLYWAKRA